MRPMDVIKRGIDSDLLKYKETSLNIIRHAKDVRDFRGVGLCAIVYPLRKYAPDDPKYSNVPLSDDFAVDQRSRVFIVNKRWEKNFHKKYYIMTINTVRDNTELAVGIAVPITFSQDFAEWNGEDFEKIKDGKEQTTEDAKKVENNINAKIS